ncbi:MAG: BlaI/MecI/CopY family transcriptional regulator [Methanomassiliicoccus sp.]|nr:BlaI/MecI/CopY family transcriptional regulator [Methanomassiliicoccus sp.]
MKEKEKCALPQYSLEGMSTDSFLGPLESRVLDTIWSSEKRPLTVREVHRMMEADKLAYTTIMTTMNRLFEKNLLDREVRSGKGGLHYTYWPRMEKETFERTAIQGVLDSLIEKFGEKVTHCFVERVAMDKEGLDKLKRELGRIEE